ncbi:hypothetical protein L7F22_046893 [Adiantum nelumboides]|nr:hypothetical protein [Adiantum nelumboides]
MEFWGINTDAQALVQLVAPQRLQIRQELTRGLSTGGKPELGKQSAKESKSVIQDAVANAKLVFIIAGMGGGTGSGAALAISQMSKEARNLIVEVVTILKVAKSCKECKNKKGAPLV